MNRKYRNQEKRNPLLISSSDFISSWLEKPEVFNIIEQNMCRKVCNLFSEKHTKETFLMANELYLRSVLPLLTHIKMPLTNVLSRYVLPSLAASLHNVPKKISSKDRTPQIKKKGGGELNST